jgi:hypothetical protein
MFRRSSWLKLCLSEINSHIQMMKSAADMSIDAFRPAVEAISLRFGRRWMMSLVNGVRSRITQSNHAVSTAVAALS